LAQAALASEGADHSRPPSELSPRSVAMAIWAQQMMGMRSNALQCLSEMDGITVQENVNVIEAVTALLGQEVEMANAYQVYASGGWDDKFKAVEQTNLCLRNLKQIFGDCTPWSLDIFYREGMGDEKAFHLDRPCSATCCCICRPVANMVDAEGNAIGSLRDPWDPCCGLGFEVMDAEGNKVYDMTSGACPMGFYCPLPCLPKLRDIKFTIKNTDGEEVGQLTKRVPNMFKYMFAPDVDDYHVEWPGVEQPEHRALIMAGTMFIDFRYFNDNSNDDKGGESESAESPEA